MIYNKHLKNLLKMLLLCISIFMLTSSVCNEKFEVYNFINNVKITYPDINSTVNKEVKKYLKDIVNDFNNVEANYELYQYQNYYSIYYPDINKGIILKDDGTLVENTSINDKMLVNLNYSAHSYAKELDIENSEYTFIDYYLRDNALIANYDKFSFEVNLNAYVKYLEYDLGIVNNKIIHQPYRYIDESKNLVALTFDDGITAVSKEVVEILNSYNVKATFYIVGDNVIDKNHDEFIIEMINAGHELGNHTKTHPYLKKLSDEEIYDEFNSLNNYISTITNNEYHLKTFRPPYASYNQKVLDIVNMPWIMWSLDTLDWKLKDPVLIKEYMIDNVQPNDVILLHDIHKTTKDSLKDIIEYLLANNYEFVTISELMAYHEVELEASSIYGSLNHITEIRGKD